MNGGARRLGILAGGGGLPREIADSAAARGIPVSIVAIDGEADADFGTHPVTVVNWGQIGAMIRAFRAARVADLVIVGSVHRPEVGRLRPDLGFFRYLPKILKIVAAGGDDGVLRRVVRFFEEQGFRVVGPGEAAPEIVIGDGAMGAKKPSPSDQADIARGLDLIRTLGAYDIGQSVIVAGGRIEAIEGAEGTDRMLARAAEARKATGGRAHRGVLVKRSKPSQDIRIDMPAIGPATVQGASQAGLAGIAVEAGKVLVAERVRTLSRADAADLFIEGVNDGEPDVAHRRFDPERTAISFRTLGRVAPTGHATQDAIKGIATVDALAAFAAGRAAVVVRNHVLAVEAGEGVGSTVARAAGLRQWASITRQRRGVACVEDASHLTLSLIDAVAAAGYAGVAIARQRIETDGAFENVIAEANRRGLFVLLRAAAEDLLS